MQQIEVGGKFYTIDTSEVSIGDFIKATEDTRSEDNNIRGAAFNVILRKTLGDQILVIPIAHYSYVLNKVVEALLAPFSTSVVDDEMREILDREEDGGV